MPRKSTSVEGNVIFIRNVMIGRNGLTADYLTRTIEDAGGERVRNHLSTGNLTFHATPKVADLARRQIAMAVEEMLGRKEEIFLRTVEYLQSIIDRDPFKEFRDAEVYERCVTFLHGPVELGTQFPIDSKRGDASLISSTSHEVFGVTCLVQGRPGKPGEMVERLTGARVNTRNWNTIEQILAWSDRIVS